MELEAGSGEHEGTFSGALCVKLRNRTHMHAPLRARPLSLASKLVVLLVAAVVSFQEEDAKLA